MLLVLGWSFSDLAAQDFKVLGFGITAQGNFAISHVSDTNAYYVLYRGDSVNSIHQVAAVSLGIGGTSQLIDPAPVSIAGQGFYRLRQVARSATVDIDGDGVPWPGDPSALASAVNPGTVTSMGDATQFLYSGPNPSQIGVANGVFDGQRVCVLRGKAMQRDGTAIAGVLISILGHPEFGRTKTRADGVFDFAVNGGARLTVKFDRPGYVPLQRPIVAPWGDYANLPDVVLIGADAATTQVTLGPNTLLQVARGTMQTDGDGSRRATLILPAGTGASLIVNGQTQNCTALTLRLTEFTVGNPGPAAMPGQLPSNSAYTYCVDLSADEAVALGAEVQFTQPVCLYTENFLNFPVGQTVPVGAYDHQQGNWAAGQNGRVVRVLGVTNGVAYLDVSGSGQAANQTQLLTLGFTDAELRQLAQLYGPGLSLWRSRVTHFSPWDCNWDKGPPPDAQPPPVPPGGQNPDNTCNAGGSIIDVERQTLGEKVPLVGTPYWLHYHSDRVRGFQPLYLLQIPLSNTSPPPDLKRITLQTEVVGRKVEQQFSPAPNQVEIFTWDGLEVYGRALRGTYPVTVRVGYVYEATYIAPGQFEQAFAAYPDTLITGNKSRDEVTLWKQWRAFVGNLLSDGVGLGSWTLDIHHAYDPRARILHLGDGTQRSTAALQSTIIGTYAGGAFASANNGDGGPATKARLSSPSGLVAAPDGSLYIAEQVGNRIRKVAPNGIISTVAGSVNGLSCANPTNACGDGGPATLALLNNPQGLALDSVGALYIAERGTSRIRRIDTNGIINTIAGTGVPGFSGDGGPAMQANLNQPYGVSVAPDGSIYIADTGNARVRRITVDGIIRTIAGTGFTPFNGDGIPAAQAQLNRPYRAVFGPDENLYIVDSGQNRIRRVGIDGIITTVAGNGGISQFSGDGGAATLANLNSPQDIAFGSDSSFFVGDTSNYRVRFIGPEDVITTIAGKGTSILFGDGGPATQAGFSEPIGIASSPDGNLYISDWFNNRVRRVTSALPGFSPGDFIIPSQDGRELYVFDNSGKHLQTLDAFTSVPRYNFSYDTQNRLSTVTDGDGNVTTIQRDALGSPTAIVSPYGQQTTLTLDTNGYLASISNPANETYRFGYSADGLMLSMTNPRTNNWIFSYDSVGRLAQDADPAGGFKTLNRAETPSYYGVETHTALQRTNRYELFKLPSGSRRRVHTFPTGLQAESWELSDGTITNRWPDGTLATAIAGPDPRWGMLAPLSQSDLLGTPGGPTNSSSVQRGATLTNATDPLSLSQWTETNRVNGRAYLTAFGTAGRMQTNTSPVGRHAITSYDSLMRPLRVDLQGLAPILFAYDTRGRLVSVAQGSGARGRTNLLYYDALGNLTNRVDPLGRSTLFAYDAAARVTNVTFADGRVLRQDYDAGGNVAAVTPPGRSAHAFTYTPVDLASQYSPPVVSPGQNSTLFGFNADRDLTLISRPDGLTTVFDWTGGGCSCDRLNSVTDPRGTISYTYDPLTGNLAMLTAPDRVNLAFSYAGNLLTNETWSGLVGASVGYSFDNDWDVATRQVNNASPISFQYDADKLLTQAGGLTITRDTNGLVIRAILGGITNSWSYNEFAEPTNSVATFGANSLYAAQYVYDSAGRIAVKTETIAGVTNQYAYIYDRSDRLIAVTLNGGTNNQYGYDDNDNRLSTTAGGQTQAATCDQQDRLITYGSANFTYSANGELASKSSGGQNTTFEYDVLGNLIHVVLPDGTDVRYLVDGLNRRIGKKVNNVLTQGFLYDNNRRVIAELNGTGSVVSEFVYGTSDHSPDYMIKGGQTYRFVLDHLGSPRLVVNAATGQVQQRIDYDPFGQVLADSTPGFQPFGFAGGLYDNQTGLVRFGARDYDAGMGRWTAKDPLLFGGGQPNLYVHVRNNPINLTDPAGLDDSGGAGPKDLRVQKVENLKQQMENAGIKFGGYEDPCFKFNKKQSEDKGMQPPPSQIKGFSITISL